jgi:hypothetical protein
VHDRSFFAALQRPDAFVVVQDFSPQAFTFQDSVGIENMRRSAVSLVSSTYEQPNGKGKKAKTAKMTSWSIRADVVRKLDRGEPEPQAPASTLAASGQTPESSEEISLLAAAIELAFRDNREAFFARQSAASTVSIWTRLASRS